MLAVARLRSTDLRYDLGCGDGPIVVTAAKKYGVHAVGFDLDPDRVRDAREHPRLAGVEDLVTIRQQDLFTVDLSPASVATLYLLARINLMLIPGGAHRVAHLRHRAGAARWAVDDERGVARRALCNRAPPA